MIMNFRVSFPIFFVGTLLAASVFGQSQAKSNALLNALNNAKAMASNQSQDIVLRLIALQHIGQICSTEVHGIDTHQIHAADFLIDQLGNTNQTIATAAGDALKDSADFSVSYMIAKKLKGNTFQKNQIEFTTSPNPIVINDALLQRSVFESFVLHASNLNDPTNGVAMKQSQEFKNVVAVLKVVSDPANSQFDDLHQIYVARSLAELVKNKKLSFALRKPIIEHMGALAGSSEFALQLIGTEALLRMTETGFTDSVDVRNEIRNQFSSLIGSSSAYVMQNVAQGISQLLVTTEFEKLKTADWKTPSAIGPYRNFKATLDVMFGKKNASDNHVRRLLFSDLKKTLENGNIASDDFKAFRIGLGTYLNSKIHSTTASDVEAWVTEAINFLAFPTDISPADRAELITGFGSKLEQIKAKIGETSELEGAELNNKLTEVVNLLAVLDSEIDKIRQSPKATTTPTVVENSSSVAEEDNSNTLAGQGQTSNDNAPTRAYATQKRFVSNRGKFASELRMATNATTLDQQVVGSVSSPTTRAKREIPDDQRISFGEIKFDNNKQSTKGANKIDQLRIPTSPNKNEGE